jgi:hypothetical protein
MAAPPAKSFSEIFGEEKIEINASRGLRGQSSLEQNPDLAALTFSGGGIRSAIFNLGILQGLAKNGLLRQFDYLSTVSGGGYISAWLVGWMRRAGSKQVEQRLKENSQPPPLAEAGRYLEPDQVRFLRRYATYLAPRSGMLSADTWTMVAIYLRNLILNLTLLVIFGAGVLLIPDLVLWRTRSFSGAGYGLWISLFICLFISAITIGIGLGGLSNDSPARRGWRRIVLFHEGIFAAVPLFAAALTGTFLLRESIMSSWRQAGQMSAVVWIHNGAVLYTVGWVLALGIRYLNQKGNYPKPVAGGFGGWLIAIGATIIAGMLQGYLVYGVARLFIYLFQQGIGSGDLQWIKVVPLVFGPPLLVGSLLLAAVFHMGLAGRAAPDALREWAARAAAILSLLTVGWIALFGVSLYGPLIVKWLIASDWASTQWGNIFKWLIGSGWAAISAGGVLAGKNASTGGNGGKMRWLTKIAPPVFILGFVLLLSYGVDVTLPRLPGRQDSNNVSAQQQSNPSVAQKNTNDAPNPTMETTAATSSLSLSQGRTPRDMHYFAERHWSRVQKYEDRRLLGYFLVCVLLVALLEWRVDVNEFSMHLFYRNRLTRTFLGASQTKRISDPFTGFSEDDDIALYDLRTGCKQLREPMDLPEQTGAEGADPNPESWSVGYDGPYPLYCTALNEVQGKELAWRTRKATSFVYSPLNCGYDYFVMPNREKPGRYAPSAYRTTQDYSQTGGPMMGTAIAISGAAASPNMGYHSSPAIGFLMALFNVRLGWWAGNPRHPYTWQRYGPWWGLLYLLRELFPDTSDQMAYVYLSDGGHFENLGVYELLRRQTQYIICCDADCDLSSTFDNLGNLVEKCRSDFGVNIHIDVAKLKRDENRISKAHYAIGTIYYRNNTQGKLLYIKPTLTGSEPEDVQAYTAKNGAFPHDSTSNQFFDESQFESYRSLGEHILFQMIREATIPATKGGAAVAPATISDLFKNLIQVQTDAANDWMEVGAPLHENMKVSVKKA